MPFDYQSKEWIAAMQQFGSVEAVFDPLAYKSFEESYSILRKGVTLVGYSLSLPRFTGAKPWSVLMQALKLYARMRRMTGLDRLS